MFVLLSAREGTLSWRPGLDRLPRVVAKRYPDLCFISIYPTEVETETTGRENDLTLKLLNQKRIHPKLSGRNLEEELIEILKIDVDVKREDVKRLVRRLLNNSEGYSPEMMAGVILYDAHTSLVSEQMLFIGIREEGLKVEKTANEVHVILILLSPKDMRVNEHLKGVNTVAKMIRPGELLNVLKNAKTPEDVYNAIVRQ
jgi:mannitol/fructose-specific phosphotransferase system IIA component (Ntr-type)